MNPPDLLHFSASEATTLESAMSRIIPTDDQPGAREALTVRWLDRYLSGTTYVHAKPDGTGFLTLAPRNERVWAERIRRMAEEYRLGIARLDELATEHFDCAFSDATPEHQDEVLRRAEIDGRSDSKVLRANENSFDEDTAEFFDLLVVHTRQAFYSDPVYGGNVDHVGWRFIGFPGPTSMAQVQRGEFDTSAYFADDDQLEDSI